MSPDVAEMRALLSVLLFDQALRALLPVPTTAAEEFVANSCAVHHAMTGHACQASPATLFLHTRMAFSTARPLFCEQINMLQASPSATI